MGRWKTKALFPKYTTYHSFTSLLDHMYAATDRGLYRSQEPMKGDRARRDIKRNCAFYKDIGNDADRCVVLKYEIERLIRAGYFKEFVEEP